MPLTRIGGGGITGKEKFEKKSGLEWEVWLVAEKRLKLMFKLYYHANRRR